MQHIYWIKSSQTWTCPKAGAWKIVCVGGGASGGIIFRENTDALQSAGGSTSFGNLLSASGGAIGSACASHINSCGGYGGYDGMNYGGMPAIITKSSDYYMAAASSGNGGTPGSPGLGYGAGGGIGYVFQMGYKNSTSTTVTQQANVYAVPGKCGSMTIGIFDLALNQNIPCTIGTSAKPSINQNTLIQQLKKSISDITEIAGDHVNRIAMAFTAGTAGVIYIEFLG